MRFNCPLFNTHIVCLSIEYREHVLIKHEQPIYSGVLSLPFKSNMISYIIFLYLQYQHEQIN